MPLLYQHGEYGGARTSDAAGEGEKVRCFCVCPSGFCKKIMMTVSLTQPFEFRNGFNVVDRKGFVDDVHVRLSLRC